jgi:protease-4
MHSFFTRVGHLLTLLRVWAVNLLSLVMLVYVLGLVGWVIWHMPGRVDPEGRVLVIAPKGIIREQAVSPSLAAFPAGALTGPQVQTRDLVRVIRAASADTRLAGVVVDFSEAEFSGSSTALRLAGELAALRDTSDRPVIAYSQTLTTGSYLMAAQADEVYVHPSGAVAISGVGGYRDYYRELTEKLKITIHNYSQGDFKSATESLTRNDISDADRLQRTELLEPIWAALKARLSGARGVPADALQRMADDYPVVLAREGAYDNLGMARELRLIDGTMSLPEFRAYMIGKFGRDEEEDERETYPHIGADDYLAQLPEEQETQDRVAVVFVEGVIKPGAIAPGIAGAEDIAGQIRRAHEDEQTRALVLRVNSPGGSIIASDMIRDELVAARSKGLPVVISMGDVAASGGLWVSTPADAIYAEPTTITGSIGVAVAFPTLENLFAYLGIHTDGVTTSEHAGWGLQQGVDERLDTIFARWASSAYGHFIDLVAAGRGRDPDYIRSIAGGRVWIATTAQELGLVDKLGSVDDAIADAAKRAGLSDYSVRYVVSEPDPLFRVLQRFGVGVAEIAGAPGSGFAGRFGQLLSLVEGIDEPTITVMCASCLIQLL